MWLNVVILCCTYSVMIYLIINLDLASKYDEKYILTFFHCSKNDMNAKCNFDWQTFLTIQSPKLFLHKIKIGAKMS